MIYFQVEYEPNSVTAYNHTLRGNHPNQVTTVAYNTPSSGVTSTFVPFPNYRHHFSSHDVLPSSQPIPVCYGSPYSTHFESSYGVMSLSAFNELYKTTNASTHFQPIRFDDTEISYAHENQLGSTFKIIVYATYANVEKITIITESFTRFGSILCEVGQ